MVSIRTQLTQKKSWLETRPYEGHCNNTTRESTQGVDDSQPTMSEMIKGKMLKWATPTTQWKVACFDNYG